MDQRQKVGIAAALVGAFLWVFSLTMPSGTASESVQAIGILGVAVGVLVAVVALFAQRGD